jgi:AraC-like DNA-binding protein
MGEMPDGQAAFSTADPEQAHEFIRRAYADHALRIGGDPEGFAFRHDFAPGDGFVLARMRHTMRVEMDADPLHDDMIAVDRLDHGYLSFEAGQDVVRSGPDQPVLLPPSAPWRCTWEDPDVEVVTLDWKAVATYASDATGIAPDQLAFHAMAPPSPELAHLWMAAVEHVRTTALGSPLAVTSPIILAQGFRSLAAALLATFPNTAQDAANDPYSRRQDVSAADVRRALDFVDEHAGEPVSRGDVAREVGVHATDLDRALHQRDTDLAYRLWRARLDGADRELRRSDPTSGVTVAAVAHRWGFADLATFSALYLATFRRTPRRTLDD